MWVLRGVARCGAVSDGMGQPDRGQILDRRAARARGGAI